MTAVVDVVPIASGDRAAGGVPVRRGVGDRAGDGHVRLREHRDGGPGDGGYTGVRYAIWVVGQDGRDDGGQGLDRPVGAHHAPVRGHPAGGASQIASVEIRLADTGAPVMRAQVPDLGRPAPGRAGARAEPAPCRQARAYRGAVFRDGRCWCYCFVRIMGLWRSW